MCFISLVKKYIIIFRISFGSKIVGMLVYVQNGWLCKLYIYTYKKLKALKIRCHSNGVKEDRIPVGIENLIRDTTTTN